MTNVVDTYKTRFLLFLIWVYTVCVYLFIHILRKNAIHRRTLKLGPDQNMQSDIDIHYSLMSRRTISHGLALISSLI